MGRTPGGHVTNDYGKRGATSSAAEPVDGRNSRTKVKLKSLYDQCEWYLPIKMWDYFIAVLLCVFIYFFCSGADTHVSDGC